MGNKSATSTQAVQKKILLLGCGEAGKRTLFLQAKHHVEPFDDMLRGAKQAVFQSILDACRSLASFIKEKNASLDAHTMELLQDIENISDEELLLNCEQTMQNCRLKRLFADTEVQKIWSECKYSSSSIPDGASYFIDGIDKYDTATFQPSFHDLIHARVKTLGVTETLLQYPGDKSKCNFVLVAGQRSERRKWIHAMRDVSDIIFVVSLSDYNLVLEEDRSCNRLEESFAVFQQLIKQDQLKNAKIHLLFSKVDVFQEKIQTYPLGDYAFTKQCAYASPLRMIEWIQEKFIKEATSARLSCKSYLVNCVDTNAGEWLWNLVRSPSPVESMRHNLRNCWFEEHLVRRSFPDITIITES